MATLGFSSFNSSRQQNFPRYVTGLLSKALSLTQEQINKFNRLSLEVETAVLSVLLFNIDVRKKVRKINYCITIVNFILK